MSNKTNSKNFNIDPTDDDFQTILICAERYACGRRSYVPSIVIGFITPLLPILSDRTLAALQRDISESKERNQLGDPRIDAPEWIELLDKIKKEANNRNPEGK